MIISEASAGVISVMLSRQNDLQACVFVENDDRHRSKVRKGTISLVETEETNLLCMVSRRYNPCVKEYVKEFRKGF